MMVASWMGINFAEVALGGGGIEDALKGAAGQVPALIVLVVVVRYFLVAIGESRKEYLANLASIMVNHQSQWSAIHQDTSQARVEMGRMLERQIITAEKHTEATNSLASALAACDLRTVTKKG
jgi:hypothetical protein